MAATIVRLEGNSYRLSCRKVKLSCHCLCVSRRGMTLFRYHFNIVFTHTSRRNKHAQFFLFVFLDISSFCILFIHVFFFKLSHLSRMPHIQYYYKPAGLSLSCSLFSQGLPHYQRRAEPHFQRHAWQRILLITYIIGNKYIHFWSFQIRHHQTC